MPVQSWDAPEAEASALTTQFDSLANATLSTLSSAIDNEAGQYEYLAVEVALTSINPSGTPYVEVWIFYSLDGTNFEDGNVALSHCLAATLPVTTGSSAKRVTSRLIPLLPLQFKLAVRNMTGVSFAASGSTLKYSRMNLEAE